MSDRETGGQMVRAEGDALAPMGESAARAFEQVVIKNDLKQLDPTARVAYYHALCNSLGLNPLTRPFLYLELSGKLVLYATKDCTEQLRSNKRVSLLEPRYDWSERALVVTVTARTPDGRTDSDIGVADIGKRAGEALENAIKKAVTQAKRRVTLSICGLGALDASEVPDIPSAHMVAVDMETGEVLDHAPRGRVDRDEPAVSPEETARRVDMACAQFAKAETAAAWNTLYAACAPWAELLDDEQLAKLKSASASAKTRIRAAREQAAEPEAAKLDREQRQAEEHDDEGDPWGDEPTGGEDGE